jgi:hypothetical protein
MHSMTTALVAVVVGLGLAAGPADAAKKKRGPVYARPVAAYPAPAPDHTVVRINGRTRIIVNRRSYLDPGPEIGPNERSYRDYVFPTGGDPGHPNWFYGPDYRGAGHYPLPGPFGQ